MSTMKRCKTKYPGVIYIVSKTGEKIYYIIYRKNGKQVEEKVGYQYIDDMTPSRAAGVRSDRMQGKAQTNKEKRQERNNRATEWTIGSLKEEYFKLLSGRSKMTDTSFWKNYLEKQFSSKRPQDLIKLDTDRLRVNILKEKSSQTVKHILGLLRRIVNYGVSMGYIKPLSFKIQMPKVDNVKTEDLTPAQLKRLLRALEESPHKTAVSIMSIALYSGMRRGEIFKLKWTDIDFHRGFILIRSPKGGKSQKIPLNVNTKNVIKNIPDNHTEFLFPSSRSRTGHVFTIDKHANEIKKDANLPKDFRPMHGLRHLYASMLASSGKVDMYTLQKLLTHKSHGMTQRYAHMRDDALREASTVVDDIFAEVGS